MGTEKVRQTERDCSADQQRFMRDLAG